MKGEFDPSKKKKKLTNREKKKMKEKQAKYVWFNVAFFCSNGMHRLQKYQLSGKKRHLDNCRLWKYQLKGVCDF